MGVAATLSATDERIGNHGRGLRGAGDGATLNGGYHTTSCQHSDAPSLPAAQCVNVTSHAAHPGRGWGVI